MDVTMAVAAEDAQIVGAVTGGRKVNILGLFDHVVCTGMPCSFEQITVVIGFSADLTEFRTQRAVQVYLVDPDGELIEGRERTHTIPASPHSGSRSFFRTFFYFQNVTFFKFGPHSFRVKVDEDHKVDVPIYVSEQSTGGS